MRFVKPKLGTLVGGPLLVAATVALAVGSPGAELPTPAVPTPPSLRVVLDPGHGGSNAGALGATGTHEKELTLALARQVQTRLLAYGFDARLTRDNDKTMTLRQRMEIANRWPADVLVSLHANASSTRTQRGFETYVLTPNAIDIDARAIRSDSGTPRPGVDPQIALMLDDVERGAIQWESAELAAEIQERLRKVRDPKFDRGVRQDSQHVLLGATMPSVLVEVGFIDHPIEGRELVTPDAQAAIADALAEAIRASLTST